MNTLSLRVRYRPVRIGLCVRSGNWEQLRSALQLTNTLWGGRYNPVIPVDNARVANLLMKVFHVDTLYPASADPAIRDFIKRFPYLPWPSSSEHEIFAAGPGGKKPVLLDVSHSMRRMSDGRLQSLPEDKMVTAIVEWSETDPLAYAFLSGFGAYPPAHVTGRDYAVQAEQLLAATRVVLDADLPVYPELVEYLLPVDFTTQDLRPDNASFGGFDGFYVGDASDFTDLVSFWNLRASGAELVFFDPAHAKRLDPLRERHLARIEKRPPDPHWGSKYPISVWKGVSGLHVDLTLFGGSKAVAYLADEQNWDRAASAGPPLAYFGEQAALGSVSDAGGRRYVTFQLPEMPFLGDPREWCDQLVAVSLQPGVDSFDHEKGTFQVPYIPELNKYFGRESYYEEDVARVEEDGLAIIIPAYKHELTLRALEARSLIAKVFGTYGMKAEPSQAGRVASRLIQQMGGIQGCRVFKIRGVRQLIQKYSPYQSFNRSAAIQTIGENDPKTGRPNFSDYEGLYIAPRERGYLKPEDGFRYLNEKGVFRVGLTFHCPSCELDFWMPLDDVKTIAECEYCGERFNVTGQLRDRDWAYRRSGLFGREDNQEGGVPVALTLQLLDSTLHSHALVYVTSMTITTQGAQQRSCETDFVAIVQRDTMGLSYDQRVSLVIGECKAAGEITQEDVDNLQEVADVFPSDRFDVFIVFSKLASFSEDEVKRCLAAQDKKSSRVILFSDRELEQFHPYDKAALEFDVDRYVSSLADFATKTRYIYFEPKRKVSP